MRIVTRACLLVIATLQSAAQAHGAAGDLDRSFGDRGVSITDVGFNAEPRYGLVIQPDGHIVLAGCRDAFALVRVDEHGLPDTGFGSAGIVVTPIGHCAFALALQPDGKLVAAGGGALGRLLIRYNADGTLDPSFADAGVASIAVGGATGIAIQPDGRIVTVGGTHIVRHNPDGTLDGSFGSGGIVIDGGASIEIQPDGKLVGTVTSPDELSMGVRRYNSDGSPDLTFGESGSALALFGTPTTARSLRLDPGGRILVVGETYVGGQPRGALARFRPNGSLDPTFGAAGQLTLLTGPFTFANALAQQADGKIVVAGEGLMHGFALARLHTDGTFDTSFGSAGSVLTNIGTDPREAQVLALAIQPDGKLVASGAAYDIDAESLYFTIARYHAASTCGDGAPDIGQACDDGNAVDGDDCDSNCSVTACGNGIMTTGEQCDDGNLVDGDGCSAICADAAAPETLSNSTLQQGESLSTDIEADGPTAADPVETTVALSVGTASATITESMGAPPIGSAYTFVGQQVDITVDCPLAPCPTAAEPLQIVFGIDASRIPGGENEQTILVLRNGSVVEPCSGSGSPGAATPDPCVADRVRFYTGNVRLTVRTSHASAWNLAVSPLPVCPATPATCVGPGKSQIKLKTQLGHADRTKIAWQWSKGAIDNVAAFGDPSTATGYAVCAYDGDSLVGTYGVEAAGACESKPCWRRLGERGFAFKHPLGNTHGITKLVVKSGETNAKILLKAKGADVPLPSSSPLFTQDVTIQLIRKGSSQCWGATYPTPATKSSSEEFADRIP